MSDLTPQAKQRLEGNTMTEASLAPLRILIVEDSEQMRTLLEALLEAMSITDILIAEDGEPHDISFA